MNPPKLYIRFTKDKSPFLVLILEKRHFKSSFRNYKNKDLINPALKNTINTNHKFVLTLHLKDKTYRTLEVLSNRHVLRKEIAISPKIQLEFKNIKIPRESLDLVDPKITKENAHLLPLYRKAIETLLPGKETTFTNTFLKPEPSELEDTLQTLASLEKQAKINKI